MLKKLKPNVGGIWRADELWVKIKGDIKYLFASHFSHQTRKIKTVLAISHAAFTGIRYHQLHAYKMRGIQSYFLTIQQGQKNEEISDCVTYL